MGTMNVDTKKILDDIAKDSIYAKGVASASLTYCCKLFQAGMIPGSVLELGPAEGLMTKVLYGDAQAFLKWSGGNKKYTVVEGSSIFAQALQERYPNMDVHACLVEEYEPETKYENIIWDMSWNMWKIRLLCFCNVEIGLHRMGAFLQQCRTQKASTGRQIGRASCRERV